MDEDLFCSREALLRFFSSRISALDIEVCERLQNAFIELASLRFSKSPLSLV
jgi:hypothetical protein